MRVITEFVKNDLSEDQLMPVVEGLMPALLGVLGDERVSLWAFSRFVVTWGRGRGRRPGGEGRERGGEEREEGRMPTGDQ